MTGRLMPDFKTIADIRRDNGPAIQATYRQFVLLCRKLKLFFEAVVAIDGSKFKAVNNRDKNYTPAKLQSRIGQIEANVARYLLAMDAADRQEGEVAQTKSVRLKEKIAVLREHVQRFRAMEDAVRAAPDQQVSLTDPDARSMAISGKGTGIVGYNVQAASRLAATRRARCSVVSTVAAVSSSAPAATCCRSTRARSPAWSSASSPHRRRPGGILGTKPARRDDDRGRPTGRPAR